MRAVALVGCIVLLTCALVGGTTTLKVNENEAVNLGIKASDPDKNTNLTYFFTPPLDENGFWQTAYGDAGVYNITIVVSDGELSSSQTVILTVDKVNVPPTIEKASPESSSITMDEAQSVTFSIQALDPNRDPLSYAWTLNQDTVSNTESFTFSPYYGESGTHRVEVSITDGEETITNSWTVTVLKVDREELLNSITDITITETESVILNLPDFKAYNLAVSISPPLENERWLTTYTDEGTYPVTISISDGDFKASKEITVTVLDKDRAPTLKPIANVWMRENQKVSFDIEISDPDGDDVNVEVENVPKGASFDGKTFSWETNYDTVLKDNLLETILGKFHLLYSPFKITFIGKSKGSEVRQSMYIFVKEVNRPPVLEKPSKITVTEGDTISVSPKASDPDNDHLTFSYSGWLRNSPYTTTFDDEGTYIITVTASDGFLTHKQDLEIEVQNKNRPPIFSEIEPKTVKEGETISFAVVASDPDGEPVSVVLPVLPQNAAFNNKIFTWTPDYDTVKKLEPGIFGITFTASDGKSESTLKVLVTVYDVNRPPVIKQTKPKQYVDWVTGKPITFIVDAFDPDADPLEYTWTFGLFESYNATPAMQRIFSAPGTKKVSVSVSDGQEEVNREWNVRIFQAVTTN